jgi:hypothetical protein
MDRRGRAALLAPRFVVALLAAASLAACADRVATVRFTFTRTDQEYAMSLSCREPDGGSFLVSRTTGEPATNVVVDFFAIAEEPSCSDGLVVDYCTAHCCPRVGPRACVSLPPPAAGVTDPQALGRHILDNLRGRLIVDNAPTVNVVVRAVVTTEPCDHFVTDGGTPYERPFDAAQLVGCGTSCPTTLQSFDGGSVGLRIQRLPLAAPCGLADVYGCATGFEQLSERSCGTR